MAEEQRRYSVGYVLAYYAPNYVRAHTQLEGLRRLPHVTLHEASNRITNPLRYLETLVRLIWLRLRHHPDIYILGFRGVEFFWPVRILTLGMPLVLDHMMSPYDSLVNETKTASPKSLLARILYFLERSAVRASNAVLTDTTLHSEYFSQLYDLPRSKIYAVPIGSFEGNHQTGGELKSDGRDTESLEVLFFGTFLPLHGMDVILDAAARLTDLPVRFVLLGGRGKDLSEFRRQREELGLTNVEHVEWVPPDRIPEYIARADLHLGGPFGGTGQALRVVTGKSLQTLAAGQPTIVGNLPQNYGFVDRENCLLVPQRDPESLAESIRWAYHHRDRLPEIGREGYRLYCDRFSIKVIGETLDAILSSILFAARS